MAIQRCRECNQRVSTEATVCPKCGAPNPTVPRAKKAVRPKSRIGASLFVVLGVTALVLYLGSGSSGQSAAADPDAESNTAGTPSQRDETIAAMQRQAAIQTQSSREAQAIKEASAAAELQATRAEQQAFEKARVGLYSAYKNAPNEIQASAIFNRANSKTNELVARMGPRIIDWSGSISEIRTSHGGGDVHVEITTPNNVVYKTDDDIPAASPVYRQLATLRNGQAVFFSGTLIPGATVGNKWEYSMTEAGSLQNPEFMIQFSSIGTSPQQ